MSLVEIVFVLWAAMLLAHATRGLGSTLRRRRTGASAAPTDLTGRPF